MLADCSIRGTLLSRLGTFGNLDVTTDGDLEGCRLMRLYRMLQEVI